MPNILISILKQLLSVAMLKPSPYLTFISRLIGQNHPHPLRFIGLPLTHISLILGSPPAGSMLQPSQKLALVHLPVIP
jgi:hypothetical protein